MQPTHRERLLAALEALLYRKSFHEVIIAEVVREAAVSKRTFYENFTDLEECLLELYQFHAARVAMLLLGLSKPGSPREWIRTATYTYMQILLEALPASHHLYFDIISIGHRGIEVRHQGIQNFADMIISVIEQYLPMRRQLSPLGRDAVMTVVAGITEAILHSMECGDKSLLDRQVLVAEMLIMSIFNESNSEHSPGAELL